jgi:hypothetical protein
MKLRRIKPLWLFPAHAQLDRLAYATVNHPESGSAG